MMIGYWIQKHDYSVIEREDISLFEAIAAYEAYDWQAELAQLQKGVEGKDCPPGIGFNNGKSLTDKNGLLLHICPSDENYAFFNFHYSKQAKVLGIFASSGQEIHYVKQVARSKISELVRNFYETNIENILKIK